MTTTLDAKKGWREETDFFTRWSLYPAEPELLEMIEATGTRSLLDLGCGGAPYLGEFHRRGWTVLGCDINPEAVAVQRTVVPAESVREGDVFGVTVPEPYGTGLVRGVLYYYPTAEKLRFLDEVAPRLVADTLILEEFVVPEPKTTRDYRGLELHMEDWHALLPRLKNWAGEVRPKRDPHFLARFIQTKNPAYKPSEDLKLAQWVVLKRKP